MSRLTANEQQVEGALTQEGGNPLGTIIKTAAMLIAFPMAMKAVSGIATRASLAIGRRIVSSTAATTTSRAGFLNRFATRLSEHGNIRAQSFGSKLNRWNQGVQRSASQVADLSDIGERLSKQHYFTKNLSGKDYRIGSLTTKSATFNQNRITSYLATRHAQLTKRADTLLEDKGFSHGAFSPRTAAGKLASSNEILKLRAYRYATHAVATFPLIYPLSAAIGGTEPYGDWYKPTTMAKWTAASVPFDIGFGGFAPAMKGLGNLGSKIRLNQGDAPIQNDIIAKALRFGHQLNRTVSKVGGAVESAIEHNRNLNYRHKEGASLKSTAQGIATGFNNFIKNVTSSSSTTTSILEKRRQAFNDNTIDAINTFRSSNIKKYDPTLVDARRQIQKTYGTDPNASSHTLNILNSINTKHKITGTSKTISASDFPRYDKRSDNKTFKHIFKKIYGKDNSANPTFEMYTGLGAVKYRGSEYNISNIMPGNIINSALKFASQYMGPLSGVAARAYSQRVQQPIRIMGEGETVQLLNKPSFDNLFYDPNKQDISFKEWKNAENNDAGLGKIFIKRLQESGTAVNRENMYEATTSFTQNGLIKFQKGESGVFIGGKLHVKRDYGNNKIDMMQVGKRDGKYLRFNLLDKEVIGGWRDVENNIFHEQNRAHNTYYNRIPGQDAAATGYLGRNFIDHANPGTGIKGWLNRIGIFPHGGLEIGSKQQKSVPRAVLDYATRWRDTSNIRTFADPKSGALWKFGEAPQDPSDMVSYIGKVLDIKTANDINLAKRIGSNFAEHIKLVENIDNLHQSSSQVRVSKFLINPAAANKKTVLDRITGFEEMMQKNGIEDSLPPEMRTILSRLKNSNPENMVNMTRPSNRAGKAYEASVIDMYNLMVTKVGLTKGSSTKSSIAARDEISAFARNVGLTQEQKQFLKDVNMSVAIDQIKVPFTAGGIAKDSVTHQLQSALGFIESGAIGNNEVANNQIGLLFGKVTGVLNYNPEGKQYYQDTISKIVKAKEPILGWGEKNLATHHHRRPGADVIAIPFNNQDGQLIHGFGKSINTIDRESIANNIITITDSQISVNSAVNSINNVANMVGLGFNQETTPDVASFGKKLITKRILPAFAMMQAYQATDAFVDDSGLFDGTALGEGIGVFAASIPAKARIASQTILDVTGVSSVARGMEDLMPGVVTSPMSGAVRGVGGPLAGVALGFKMGGPTGAMAGGAIGGAISLITAGGPAAAFGYWDITKTRAEVIDEYMGKKDVAVRKGRGWELSSEMLSGGGPKYYTSNWFHKMRTGAEYTPVLYGDKLEKTFSFLDRKHYEDKHYYSRPYPVSSGIGENLPFIGKVVQVGQERMHTEDMQYLDDPFYGAGPGSLAAQSSGNSPLAGANMNLNMDQQTSTRMMQNSYGNSSGSTLGLSGGQVRDLGTVDGAMSPSDLRARSRYAFQGIQEMAGLRGWFAADTLYQNATGQYAPFEDVPMMQSAGDMASTQRAFWDLNAGNVMLMGEFGRRVIGKEPGWSEKVNPFRNMMPDWMPDNLKYGDPFTAVELGESRLPGQGYSAQNDVTYTFPGDTAVLGMDPDDIFKYYTGQDIPKTEDEKLGHFGKASAGHYADILAQQNFNAKRNITFFDAQSNISGKADLVINEGGVKSAVNVKMVSAKTFDQLGEPRPQDAGEMNGLLMLGQMNSGSVVYIDPDGRTKSFNVAPNHGRFQQDMARVANVQNALSSDIMKNGINGNFNLARAYSQTDRLKVLANVAPYSDEYFQQLGQVNKQQALGLLNKKQIDLKETAIEQRTNIVTPQYHQNRFYSIGTAATPEEEERQAEIKSKYNVLQRTAGAGWEYAMQLETPIHTKLWSNRTAIDQYEKTQVYGKSFRSWERPIDDFIKPSIDNMRKHQDPLQGALSFGTGGFLIGGPVGGIVGGTIGALHAPILGGAHTPHDVQTSRDIQWNLDQAKYNRSNTLYQQTGDETYMQERNKTLTHIIGQGGSAKISDMISAVPSQERKYMQAFMSSGTIEERERILKNVPDYIKPLLQQKWSGKAQDMPTDLNTDIMYSDEIKEDLWSPELNMQDVQLRMYQNEALDARQSGVGFYGQQHRISREQRAQKIGVHDTYSQMQSPESIISGIISGTLSSSGSDTDGIINVIIEVEG